MWMEADCLLDAIPAESFEKRVHPPSEIVGLTPVDRTRPRSEPLSSQLPEFIPQRVAILWTLVSLSLSSSVPFLLLPRRKYNRTMKQAVWRFAVRARQNVVPLIQSR